MPCRDAEERDYEWIREYIYDIKTEEHKRTFVLHQRPEYTGYLTLDTRLNLQKRGKQLKRLGKRARNDEFAFLRPSKVGPGFLKGSGRVEHSLCCACSPAGLQTSRVCRVWGQQRIGSLWLERWPERMSLSCCSPTRRAQVGAFIVDKRAD